MSNAALSNGLSDRFVQRGTARHWSLTLARGSILTSALAASAVCAKPRLEARAGVQVKDMPLSKSEQMARVRNRHTASELRLRSALWESGLRYRLHARTPVGRPDLVFPGPRVAVFIDVCFWHGCPEHYSRPLRRPGFWAEKLRTNVHRDRSQTLELERRGWTVIRIWEHEVVDDVDGLVDTIRGIVHGGSRAGRIDWRVVEVTSTADSEFEARELRARREPGQVRRETGPRITGRGRRKQVDNSARDLAAASGGSERRPAR